MPTAKPIHPEHRSQHALRRTALTLAWTLGLSLATLAHAELVLDTFDQPSPAATLVWHAGVGTSTLQQVGLSSPVPGGARDITFNVYTNPLNSVSALAAGEGRLSVAQGTGAMAETLIAYGAFTYQHGAGGPRLGLDLSKFANLRFAFSGAEEGMNVNVTYYTSAPLNPADPLYYSSAGVNTAAPAPDGSLTFTLPVGHNPHFNWRQVDGVIVLINRAGPIPHTSYTLTRLSFEP